MSTSRLIPFVLLALSPAAQALGLGEAYGQAVIGQPLALRIPLQGDGAATLAAHCVSLQSATAAIAADARLSGASVSLVAGAATPTLLVTTRAALAQPVISFGIRIDCGYQLTRDYHLLPTPPAPTAVPVSPQPPTAAPTAPAAASVRAPITAAPKVGGSMVTEQATTLRLISRQRYPHDSRARVAFIKRVAAANPERFHSIEAAYDQPLAAGVTLALPEGLPSLSAAASRPQAPPVTAPAAVKPATSGPGKGRLIIGVPEAAPAPTVAEIEESINRLMDIMNEQMAVQMSMAERLKGLEKEVAEAKKAVSSQAAVNRRMEEEIQQLREEQSRSSMIQLVLAILLGGAVGAGFLQWRARRVPRGEGAASPAPSFMPPAAPPVKARPQESMPSVFDDLLPPK